jgi:hypothetical protein
MYVWRHFNAILSFFSPPGKDWKMQGFSSAQTKFDSYFLQRKREFFSVDNERAIKRVNSHVFCLISSSVARGDSKGRWWSRIVSLFRVGRNLFVMKCLLQGQEVGPESGFRCQLLSDFYYSMIYCFENKSATQACRYLWFSPLEKGYRSTSNHALTLESEIL